MWLGVAEEREEILPLVRNMDGNSGCREAYDVREKLCTFFSSPEGSVSWQDNGDNFMWLRPTHNALC